MTTFAVSSGTHFNRKSSIDAVLVENNLVLGDADVVCGRGKVARSHFGNKRFRQLVELQRGVYQGASSREQKARISYGIVCDIRALGGRFLLLDEKTNEWIEAGDDVAKNKASHALRSVRDLTPRSVKAKRKVLDRSQMVQQNSTYVALRESQQKIFNSLMLEIDSNDDN